MKRENNMTNVELIITKHTGLVDFLIEEGYVHPDVSVVAHATPEVITGKHVLGLLPHSLSHYCASYTEIPLALPPALRGKHLNASEVRKHAGVPVTYEVRKVPKE